MKKTLILFSMATVLASCSAKNLLKPDPDVQESGTVSVSATIPADHIWSGNDAIGIYGTVKGTNARFVPFSSCLGKDGQATLYGSAVDAVHKLALGIEMCGYQFFLHICRRHETGLQTVFNLNTHRLACFVRALLHNVEEGITEVGYQRKEKYDFEESYDVSHFVLFFAF